MGCGWLDRGERQVGGQAVRAVPVQLKQQAHSSLHRLIDSSTDAERPPRKSRLCGEQFSALDVASGSQRNFRVAPQRPFGVARGCLQTSPSGVITR